MKKRLLSGFLALAILIMGMPLSAFAADADTQAAVSEVSITADGTYQLAAGAAEAITVAEGVSELTIVGSGDAQPNAVTVDCSAAPGIHLTLQDVNLSADGSVLSFSGAGNILTAEGVCLLEGGSDDGRTPLVQMAGGTELTFDGAGALYLYAANPMAEAGSFFVNGGTLSMEGGAVGGSWQIGSGAVRANWAENAAIVNAAGEALYLCRVDTSEAASDVHTVLEGETEVYSGPGFGYSHTDDGWTEQEDSGICVYLTGADHTLTVNGTERVYYWDPLFECFDVVDHVIAGFAATPSDAKIVVSNGIGYTYTEAVWESKTADGMCKYSLVPGSYTATITKDGYYASEFSFQVTEEGSITSINTSSNVKNYLNDEGVFTIALSKFQKSSNSGAWDGVTLDVSWYSENASELEISTAAQLAGMAAICNGIYNAEITTIIDDANGDGRTETYTPEEYAALSSRKIRPACSESGTGDSNMVTTDSYWYGV